MHPMHGAGHSAHAMKAAPPAGPRRATLCRMRPSPLLLPLALPMLPACSEDFGKPRTLGGQDTAPQVEPCGVTVDRTWPAHDSIGHYYQDPIEFWLSAPDDTAVVEAPMPGTTDVLENGHMLRFTPTDGFEPDAPYTFDLDYCGGRPSLSFQTSPAGLPLADVDELIGKVWLIDLGAGRFVEGEAAGELLNGIFGRALLLGVVGTEEGRIQVRGGVSTADFRDGRVEQDRCFRTVGLELLDTELPDFRFEVEGFTFGAYDVELTLAAVSVIGTVHPEGTALDGVRWSVSVSGSELAELLPGVDSAAAACEFAADLGVECTPCPDSSGEVCVSVSADRMQAPLANTTLDEITEDNQPEGCFE